jgi:catechol 2,3-dioxygenase-like lactoylglutathione lyase family enzyme
MSPPRPELNRILETSLYVEDLDRSVCFYARVFGFEVMLQDDRMCAMAVPNRQVLLLFRKGASRMPSKTPVGFIPPHDADGRQHLCWSITHDALGEWQNYLATMGVVPETRLDWPQGASSLYFRDPDGHSLELGTSGLWENDPNPGAGIKPVRRNDRPVKPQP